jgi:hypothetical protein
VWREEKAHLLDFTPFADVFEQLEGNWKRNNASRERSTAFPQGSGFPQALLQMQRPISYIM